MLDPPSLPYQRFYPRRTRMVMIGAAIGFLLGASYVLGVVVVASPEGCGQGGTPGLSESAVARQIVQHLRTGAIELLAAAGAAATGRTR